MKKPLITLLVSLLAWSAFAQESEKSRFSKEDYQRDMQNKLSSIKGIVEALYDINGFVFLSNEEGEDRSITDIVNRSTSIQIGNEENIPSAHELTWFTANEDIASIEVKGEDIRIKGHNFGETFLIGYGEETVVNNGVPSTVIKPYYFAVFVCPTVTVLSPTGVVYKYQKTYGQPMHIQFTQSPGYFVNCVMVKGLGGDNEWKDVTADVEKGQRNNLQAKASNEQSEDEGYVVGGKTNEDDGYYISDLPVTNNLLICISEESSGMAVNDKSNGEVVGSSGVNLQVRGYELTFVNANDGTPAYGGRNLLVLDLANRANEGGRIDENGKYVIRDFFPGVHLIQVEGIPGYFRVVVQDNV